MSNENKADKSSEASKPSVEQPEDLRMDRKQVTRYDYVMGLILILLVMAWLLAALLSGAGKIPEDTIAQPLFLSLFGATVLYHFLDTRAFAEQKWFSVTGAGALAIILFFTSLIWQGKQLEREDLKIIAARDNEIKELKRDLKTAEENNLQLQKENKRLEPISVMFPIEDRGGKIKDADVERNFFYGLWVEGSIDETDGEIWLRVNEVPQTNKYMFFVLDRNALKNRGDLFRKHGNIDPNELEAGLPPLKRFDTQRPLTIR